VALSGQLITPMAERGRGEVLCLLMAGNQPMPHFGGLPPPKPRSPRSRRRATRTEATATSVVTALVLGRRSSPPSSTRGRREWSRREATTPSERHDRTTGLMPGPGSKPGQGEEGEMHGGCAVKALAWFGAHARGALCATTLQK